MFEAGEAPNGTDGPNGPTQSSPNRTMPCHAPCLGTECMERGGDGERKHVKMAVDIVENLLSSAQCPVPSAECPVTRNVRHEQKKAFKSVFGRIELVASTDIYVQHLPAFWRRGGALRTSDSNY